MKRVLSLLLVLLLVFVFVACNSEAGGSGGGSGNGELSAAEQAILTKYGEDIFYFAELADLAATSGEFVEEICGAENDSARANLVSLYSSYGMHISNATSTTVTISSTDDGITTTVEVTNVNITPSKGLNDSISFDAKVTVSGKENLSAEVSLDIDLVNNTTTITKGKYKAIVLGTGSSDLGKANQCLQEIQALNDEGNGNGNGNGNGQGQGGQGQGESWTAGTASLPAHTAREIALALEGIDYYVRIEEPQGGVGVADGGVSYFYEYGIIHDDEGESVQLWAKRWDELAAKYEQDSEYDMIALDRIPEHQFLDAYSEEMSDYIFYEDLDGADGWTLPDTAVYHDDDGSRNWHEAVVYWVYDGEDIFSEAYAQDSYNATYAGGIYYHYSDLLKPYTPDLLKEYNGKYEKLSQKATVAGVTCTVYRYATELYYIADSADLFNICMKHTWLAGGKESVMFEVKEINDAPVWPIE